MLFRYLRIGIVSACFAIGFPDVIQADAIQPEAVAALAHVDKPLTTAKASKHTVVLLTRAKKKIRNELLNTEFVALLDQYAAAAVLSMTLKENRRRQHEIRKEILQLANSPRLPNVPDDARNYFISRVAKHAEKLLDNNLYVRINAVMLLAELTEEKSKELIPYAGSRSALEKVIADPQQPDAVKIPAVEGLADRFSAKVIDYAERQRQVVLIVAELRRTNTHAAYQRALAAGLAHANLIEDAKQEPVVVDALVSITKDSQRHWLVRTKAIRAFQNLPLQNADNTRKVCIEFIRLLHDAAEMYNRNPSAYYWRECFADIYFLASDRTWSDGLSSALVSTAHGVSVPVTRAVLIQRAEKFPIPRSVIDALSEWLEKYDKKD